MREAPREVYAIITVRVFLAYSWISIVAMLTTFLSDAFGYSDTLAANTYGVWGVVMSLVQFAAGILMDRIGVRRCLIAGALVNTIGMTCVAAAFDNEHLLRFGLFVLIPIGSAFGLSVTDIGGQMYSNPTNQSVIVETSAASVGFCRSFG